jgi:hypothetical protein
MNKLTKRFTTAAVAVGLVATGSIGAYAAFADTDVSDESVAEAGLVQLTVSQGKAWEGGTSPASSTAEIGPNGYIGSSYVGEMSRTTYANYAGRGAPMLNPAFSVTYAIAEEFSQQDLDDYVALQVRIRGNDCNLGNPNTEYFVDTFFVGEDVDGPRLTAANIVDPLIGFNHTFDRTNFPLMVIPTNNKICVETRLVVLDAENDAMSDDFALTQTVVVTEADTESFVFRP